jgi:hypothetical protein
MDGVKLTAEDLGGLEEQYAQIRLNASNDEDRQLAEIMCELVRLAQVGHAVETSERKH